MGEVSAVRFAGYAAVFDVADRGGDVVRRGGVRWADEVPLLWQHSGPPVGIIEHLEADTRGVRVIGRVIEARAATLVACGAITGLSFGYRARAVEQGTFRELLILDLIEVSLVAQPMQRLARIHRVEATGESA
ncbi:HK97 family phage prohead protease [Sphingomonas japonica]|uniref:Prohead serine protease domain-containing protein n=1 Tax=Sphingomonas japonica TaxID=511662 RepID=A0ABX0U0W0_9SPHN|nr:HK97 family phage prohead protease [Sphingomonas japonica]NIJ23725.1 hypothetical protein [Sphingomonas japonica]